MRKPIQSEISRIIRIKIPNIESLDNLESLDLREIGIKIKDFSDIQNLLSKGIYRDLYSEWKKRFDKNLKEFAKSHGFNPDPDI
jgi:hypothetical protein